MIQEQDLLEELRLRAAALVEAKEESDDEDEDEDDDDESDEDDEKETNGVVKDKMTEEVVDELDTKTLKSYRSKANRQKHDA
jgi:hypothetical protein